MKTDCYLKLPPNLTPKKSRNTVNYFQNWHNHLKGAKLAENICCPQNLQYFIIFFLTFQGVTFPAIYAMMALWAPPFERTKMLLIATSGAMFGTIIANPIAGVLCDSNFMHGWPSVFYLSGKIPFAPDLYMKKTGRYKEAIIFSSTMEWFHCLHLVGTLTIH